MPLTLAIDASRANVSRPTGVENYSRRVIEELKNVVPGDVRVVLYSETPLLGELAALPPNWESRVLRWPCRWFWAELRLGLEMLVRPSDVLWQPARALPFILPRRAVATVHDLGFLDFPAAYGRVNRWYQAVSAWLAVRRASVITVSDFTASRVRDVFGSPRRGLAVTPLAVDPAPFRSAAGDSAGQEERRARHGLRRPYYLFVGRLETKKNVAGLFAAYARLVAAWPEAPDLALAGPRGLGADDAFTALPDAVRPRVRELGYVEDADLPHLLAAANALVFPSRYEGFGLPVLEAFAAGVPVVCSDAASLPEVAGEAALLVGLDDTDGLARAMRSVVEDEALRARLIAAGAARVEGYSWRRTAELTWQKMKELLGR